MGCPFIVYRNRTCAARSCKPTIDIPLKVRVYGQTSQFGLQAIFADFAKDTRYVALVSLHWIVRIVTFECALLPRDRYLADECKSLYG